MLASDRARTETRALRMVASAAACSMTLLLAFSLPFPPQLLEDAWCLGTLLGFLQPLDSVSGLSSLTSTLFPFWRELDFSRSDGGDPDRTVVLSSDETSSDCGPKSMNCLGTISGTSSRLLALPLISFVVWWKQEFETL